MAKDTMTVGQSELHIREENDRLRRDIGKAETRATAQSEFIGKQSELISKLIGENMTSVDAVNKHSAERDTWKQLAQKGDDDVVGLHAEINRLREENTRLKADAYELREENVTLREERDALKQAHMAKVKQSLDNCRAFIDGLPSPPSPPFTDPDGLAHWIERAIAECRVEELVAKTDAPSQPLYGDTDSLRDEIEQRLVALESRSNEHHATIYGGGGPAMPVIGLVTRVERFEETDGVWDRLAKLEHCLDVAGPFELINDVFKANEAAIKSLSARVNALERAGQ